MASPELIPELKLSTNLKIHLKPSVPNVWQNLDSGRYTVVGTLVGKAVPKLNFGSLGGWLEGESRRGSLLKFARARHLVRKQVAPRFKNGPLLKRQIFKIREQLTECQIYHHHASLLKSSIKQEACFGAWAQSASFSLSLGMPDIT